MCGNSRGVCPILNRAAVILKTQYVLNVSCEWLEPLTFNGTGLCVLSTEVYKLRIFYFISQGTHGSVERFADTYYKITCLVPSDKGNGQGF